MNDWMMNPWTQMGLGILSANKPGASFGEAVGGGGLLGMQNYQALQDRQRLLQAQEQVAQQYPELAPILQAYPSAAPALLAAQAKGADYGNTPLYFQTPEGLKVGRFAGAGGVDFPPVPEGYEAVKPMNFQDLGGYTAAFPYGSNAPSGIYQRTPPPEQMPGFKGAQAAATAAGTTRATREAEESLDFPSVQAQTEQSIQLIDELLAHPGLELAVGKSSIIPVIPGTPQADFVTRLEQIQGQQFLEAYQQLKGGGQITEVEGKKAEAAMARMNRAQTESEFKASAKDFKDVLIKGLKRRARKEGVEWQYQAPGGLSPEQKKRLKLLENKLGVAP